MYFFYFWATALNSTANTTLTALASVLTIGLALMVMALTAKLVATGAHRRAEESTPSVPSGPEPRMEVAVGQL